MLLLIVTNNLRMQLSRNRVYQITRNRVSEANEECNKVEVVSVQLCSLKLTSTRLLSLLYLYWKNRYVKKFIKLTKTGFAIISDPPPPPRYNGNAW